MASIAPQTDSTRSGSPDQAATRNAILAAARRVAERDGVLEMSLIAVAQEAELAPGSVYALFNSKNDLLLCVIADDLATLAGAMRGAFSAEDDDSVASQAIPSPSLVPPPTPAAVSPQPQETTNMSQQQTSAAIAQVATSSGAAEAIARLQETVARLETRPVDAWLERRLREFERGLSALEGRHLEHNTAEKSAEERFQEFSQTLESLEQRLSAAAADAAHALGERIEACEKRLRDQVSEMQADTATLARRITALENTAFAAKPELFEGRATPAEPAEAADAKLEQPASDPAAPAAEALRTEPAAAPAGVSASSSTYSYLAAARKSAQAAAVTQDMRGRKAATRKSPTMVYVGMGLLFLFVAMLTAAGFLLRDVTVETSSPGPVANSQSGKHASSALLQRTAKEDPRFRLRRLAQAGDPAAELLIGLEYLDGVPQNDAAAFAWLSRAAARNQPVAQYELGVLYQDGRGVHADPAQAFRWFESAALKGNRRAMHSLATAYAEGWGTEKNLFEAARWFGRAAVMGSVNDQFNLGVLYERGMGVAQSLPDAYRWYAVAAAKGDQESQSRIAAIEPMLSPDDLAAAQSAAQSFKPYPLSPFANNPPALSQIR